MCVMCDTYFKKTEPELLISRHKREDLDIMTFYYCHSCNLILCYIELEYFDNRMTFVTTQDRKPATLAELFTCYKSDQLDKFFYYRADKQGLNLFFEHLRDYQN